MARSKGRPILARRARRVDGVALASRREDSHPLHPRRLRERLVVAQDALQVVTEPERRGDVDRVEAAQTVRSEPARRLEGRRGDLEQDQTIEHGPNVLQSIGAMRWTGRTSSVRLRSHETRSREGWSHARRAAVSASSTTSFTRAEVSR